MKIILFSIETDVFFLQRSKEKTKTLIGYVFAHGFGLAAVVCFAGECALGHFLLIARPEVSRKKSKWMDRAFRKARRWEHA